MTGPDDHSEDDIALAGEYALHLLDADARRAFAARLDREPALRALLRDWDEGLAGMAGEIDPVAPPARVKSETEARLFGAVPPARLRRPAFGRLFGGWRGAFAVAVLLALVLVTVVAPLVDAPTGPAYVADLSAGDRSLVVTARFVPRDGVLTVDRVAGGPAAGRVLELWLIAKGAAAPVSLGVLPPDRAARIPIPDRLTAGLDGGTLAISDEPPGGSPTGQPSGAVLAAGPITKL